MGAMEVSFIEPPQITFDLGRGPISQAFTLIMSSLLAKRYQGTTNLTFLKNTDLVMGEKLNSKTH